MKISNPIGITGIGDPFVIKAKDGYFYLYATSFIDGFNVWKSADLAQWSEPSVCYRKNERSFGYCDFWAPEVIYHGGKYIMHYSARRKEGNTLRIGVAVSDSPAGPFIDVYDKAPLFDFGYAAIDGHVFIDDDGKAYFYYSRDCSENIVDGVHESHMYGVELSADLLSLKGEPQFLFKPELEYEKIMYIDNENAKFLWNEGPFVIKHNGKYHMTYSSNFYAGKHYSICAAVAGSPLGKFTKYNEPVLTYIDSVISGPGHGCIVSSGGKLYCVYHVHTDFNAPSGNRQVFISEMEFIGGRLKISSLNCGNNPLQAG